MAIGNDLASEFSKGNQAYTQVSKTTSKIMQANWEALDSLRQEIAYAPVELTLPTKEAALNAIPVKRVLTEYKKDGLDKFIEFLDFLFGVQETKVPQMPVKYDFEELIGETNFAAHSRHYFVVDEENDSHKEVEAKEILNKYISKPGSLIPLEIIRKLGAQHGRDHGGLEDHLLVLKVMPDAKKSGWLTTTATRQQYNQFVELTKPDKKELNDRDRKAVKTFVSKVLFGTSGTKPKDGVLAETLCVPLARLVSLSLLDPEMGAFLANLNGSGASSENKVFVRNLISIIEKQGKPGLARSLIHEFRENKDGGEENACMLAEDACCNPGFYNDERYLNPDYALENRNEGGLWFEYFGK